MRSHPFSTCLATVAAVALVTAACGEGGGPTDSSSEVSAPQEDRPVPVEVDEVDGAALQAILDRWRTDVDASGATLSIRVPGHDDVHLASGIDDHDPETPMPTDGTYGIGSVTKSFVAATALQLVEEGELSLHEPVGRWLPELPHADEVTLAMLLGHTAGLGQWDDSEVIFADLSRSFTPEEALAMQMQAETMGEPGERFYYANAGYIAVGVLIERLLEQDLATVVAERFTGPLALSDTHVDDGSVEETRHGWLEPAPDVVIDALDLPQEALTTTVFAAGNMTSSSTDLLDWGEALYSGEVLGPETTATMLDMQSPFTSSETTGHLIGTDDRTQLHYGLGAMGYCFDDAGCSGDEVELVGHSGAVDGYRTLLAHHPASGTTVALFANWSDIPLPTIVPALTDVFGELGLT